MMLGGNEFLKVSPGGIDHLDDVAKFIRERRGSREILKFTDKPVLEKIAYSALGIIIGATLAIVLLSWKRNRTAGYPRIPTSFE